DRRSPRSGSASTIAGLQRCRFWTTSGSERSSSYPGWSATPSFLPTCSASRRPKVQMSSANDLFAIDNPATPLAERLRPKTLAEVIGQRHLLAEGKPLAVAFASGKPHSMIVWGPPGSGKTTLARMMAYGFHADFIALSAVLSG